MPSLMKCPPFIFLNSLLFLGHIIICFFYSCNHNTGTVLFSFKTVILNPFFLSPYHFPEGYTPVCNISQWFATGGGIRIWWGGDLGIPEGGLREMKHIGKEASYFPWQ